MKYPSVWRKFINGTAYFSGAIACVIALLLVMEVVLRYIFRSPTSWSLNVCMYMLCYMMFLGSSYAFQSHGHVAVDMIRDFADRHDKSGKRISRRILACIGYVLASAYLCTLVIGVWRLFRRAVMFHSKTVEYPMIPQWLIYGPMIVGICMMIITCVFMILDILHGGDEFM